MRGVRSRPTTERLCPLRRRTGGARSSHEPQHGLGRRPSDMYVRFAMGLSDGVRGWRAHDRLASGRPWGPWPTGAPDAAPARASPRAAADPRNATPTAVGRERLRVDNGLHWPIRCVIIKGK